MTSTSENPHSALPSRRTLRETGQQTQSTASDSIHTPLRVFKGRASEGSHAAHGKRAPRTVKQRVAATLAITCVAGMTLSYSLPLLGAFVDPPAEEVVEAAAQQGLFSEISVDELPVSLEEVDFAATDSNTKASYSFDPEAVVNFPFTEPVSLTDGFGYRSFPVAQFHDAQDFAASHGTPIVAIADGEVIEAGPADDGCGFGLKLEHEIDGTTVTSRYCHMVDNSHALAMGDEVKMGDSVGQVGNTGMSFGPHLHLAIRVDDEPVDPMPFLFEWNNVKLADIEKSDSDEKKSSSDKQKADDEKSGDDT